MLEPIYCVAGIGVIIVVAILCLVEKYRDKVGEPKCVVVMDEKENREKILHYFRESYLEFLQRKNEIWSVYGQILLAILIVVVIAILLLTKTISAEAGLPILSGISGFAIAKGISGNRPTSVLQDGEEQEKDMKRKQD